MELERALRGQEMSLGWGQQGGEQQARKKQDQFSAYKPKPHSSLGHFFCPLDFSKSWHYAITLTTPNHPS